MVGVEVEVEVFSISWPVPWYIRRAVMGDSKRGQQTGKESGKSAEQGIHLRSLAFVPLSSTLAVVSILSTDARF